MKRRNPVIALTPGSGDFTVFSFGKRICVMALNIATSISDQMKSIRSACALAASGPGKDTALLHLQAAEKAHADWRDDVCAKELASATLALG